MNNVFLTGFMAAGIALCQTPAPKDNPSYQDEVQGAKSAKISRNQREALATQSPSVKIHRKHHKASNARVTADKHTINAYVPERK